jgi:hypothetical protein
MSIRRAAGYNATLTPYLRGPASAIPQMRQDGLQPLAPTLAGRWIEDHEQPRGGDGSAL